MLLAGDGAIVVVTLLAVALVVALVVTLLTTSRGGSISPTVIDEDNLTEADNLRLLRPVLTSKAFGINVFAALSTSSTLTSFFILIEMKTLHSLSLLCCSYAVSFTLDNLPLTSFMILADIVSTHAP